MLLKRIIPCLDVHDGRVVKGTNFVDIRDAGDPVELAAHYDHEGADELVFLDITASHENRDTIVDLARRCAEGYLKQREAMGYPLMKAWPPPGKRSAPAIRRPAGRGRKPR